MSILTDPPNRYSEINIMAARQRLAPFTARDLSQYDETRLLRAWSEALAFEGLAYEAEDAKERIRDEYTTRYRVDLCAVTDALHEPPRSPREVDRALELLRLAPPPPRHAALPRVPDFLSDYEPIAA